jgi:hypothetical protein
MLIDWVPRFGSCTHRVTPDVHTQGCSVVDEGSIMRYLLALDD